MWLLLVMACDNGKGGGGGGGGADSPIDTGLENVGGETGEDSDPDTNPDADAQYDAFFDLNTITEVELTLSEASIAALTADPYTYAEGDLRIGDTVLTGVGVRLKGSQDLTAKPSFKISIDEYDTSLDYGGMERLTFNNMEDDAAQIREVLAFNLWAQAGMVAPRAAFSRVLVNGELFGLYASIETMDENFLARHYQDDGGDLWEANDSADLTPFGIDHFELAAGDGDKDALAIAADVINSGSGADFYTIASEVINAEQFLDYWAWNLILGNDEGYPYEQNDFFLYADPADAGRYAFCPWGLDEVFGDTLQWNYVVGMVAVRCYYDNVCQQQLIDRAANAFTVFETMDAGGLASNLYILTEAAMAEDPRRSFTVSEVEAARSELDARIVTWPAELKIQLGIQ